MSDVISEVPLRLDLLLKQQLVHQLHHLYSTASDDWDINNQSVFGFYGTYHNVYNNLIHNGHKIEFSKEHKSMMWNLAKKAFDAKYQKWIKVPKHEGNGWMKDWLKEKRDNVYKSYLVRAYLLEKRKKEGVTLQFLEEDGSPIKRLSFVSRE